MSEPNPCPHCGRLPTSPLDRIHAPTKLAAHVCNLIRKHGAHYAARALDIGLEHVCRIQRGETVTRGTVDTATEAMRTGKTKRERDRARSNP